MARTRKNDIKKFNEHLTERQREVKKELRNIVVATFNGKAGSGKTSLAVNYAYEQLSLKEINKIVITRATAMRKKHDLGFLAGTADEKMAPWSAPIFDTLYKFEPPTGEKDKVQELIKAKKLEIVPMAHIQGLTFENCVVIVDEYQNLDDKDLEGLLTRIGRNCKMIFAGDFRQSLIYNSGIHTLNEACEKFDEMEAFWFEENFRHPIVEKIIDFYEEKVIENQKQKED
jgi:phosphate starvation-inducible protein PhoH